MLPRNVHRAFYTGPSAKAPKRDPPTASMQMICTQSYSSGIHCTARGWYFSHLSCESNKLDKPSRWDISLPLGRLHGYFWKHNKIKGQKKGVAGCTIDLTSVAAPVPPAMNQAAQEDELWPGNDHGGLTQCQHLRAI